MKSATVRPLRKNIVLHTTNLTEGQALTSRIWSKHTSRVIGGGGYESSVSRLSLGRCSLSYVDCGSPMHVDAKGNRTKVTVYLPLEGSMEISAAQLNLSALPGGPALIPAATPMEFRATPIRCILLEIPAAKLRSEMAALGWTGGDEILPIAWAPGSAGAANIDHTLRFVLEYLSREDAGEKSPVVQRRIESLAVACLAEAAVDRLGSIKTAQKPFGRVSLAGMKQHIRDSLRSTCSTADLAAFAGLTPRALQKHFLKHFHTTPTAYVQEQRLAASREELSDPANDQSVTRVASDLGFHHLGRFAATYRRKFGEPPSQTLEECRNRTIQKANRK